MTNVKIKLWIILCLMGMPSFLLADANPASIMPILNVGMGARAVALGGAYSAVANDSSSIYWNPACLSRIESPEIQFAHQNLFGDTALQQFSGGLPFGRFGTLATGITYTGYGEFEARNEYGALSSSSFSAHSVGLDVAYGIALPAGFSVGSSFRFWREKIDTYSWSSSTLGIGSLYQPWPDTTFAVNLSNLGNKVEGYNLPIGIRLGVAQRISFTNNYHALVSFDYNAKKNIGSAIALGLEQAVFKMLFIRFGYNGHFDQELGTLRGLSGGLGVTYHFASMDYAISSKGDLGQEHLVSLGFGFPQLFKSAKVESGIKPEIAVAEKVTPKATATIDDSVDVPRDHLSAARKALGHKDVRTSILEYRAHLEVNASDYGTWKELGQLYYQMNLSQETIYCFEKYLRLNPTDVEINNWLESYKRWINKEQEQ